MTHEEQCRRVLTAFGASDSYTKFDRYGEIQYTATIFPPNEQRAYRLHWNLGKEDAALKQISVGMNYAEQCVAYTNEDWEQKHGVHAMEIIPGVDENAANNSQLIRGLFCLGLYASAWAHINHAVSQHEFLELRENLPRECWPAQWTQTTPKEAETLCLCG